MNRILLTLLLATLPAAAQTARTPVLVELFTSEGCSSCPPADALLARLDRDQPIPGTEIIALGEHVDYWDRLGWRDRFSSHQFTERQSQYSARFHLIDIYTPQMVVQGQTQFVGNDDRAATQAIAAAAAQANTYRFTLQSLASEAGRVTALVSAAPGTHDPPPPADFYAAIVSPHQATPVRAGENAGRTLQHAGVVRSLTPIGTSESFWKAGLPISVETRELTGPLRLVVFAQARSTGTILGALSVPIPGPTPKSASSR